MSCDLLSTPFALNNASNALKSDGRSIILLPEEVDGGDALGGGFAHPVCDIVPDGIGIVELPLADDFFHAE
jgi:hypothetical protein